VDVLKSLLTHIRYSLTLFRNCSDVCSLVNQSIALNETPSHSYGMSLVNGITQCYLSLDTSEHTLS